MMPVQVLAELDRLVTAEREAFERLYELAMARPDEALHAAVQGFAAASGLVATFTLELGKRTLPPAVES
jgi:hypothetical protein